jgi:hypothetical protein
MSGRTAVLGIGGSATNNHAGSTDEVTETIQAVHPKGRNR